MNSAALVLAVGKGLKDVPKTESARQSVRYQVLCKDTAFVGVHKVSRVQ